LLICNKLKGGAVVHYSRRSDSPLKRKIRSFCINYGASEETAYDVLTKAQWALEPIQSIGQEMDEDTRISRLEFRDPNRIHVAIMDLNSREEISLALIRDDQETKLERIQGKEPKSHDLNRIVWNLFIREGQKVFRPYFALGSYYL
jgi:hypothetical protein